MGQVMDMMIKPSNSVLHETLHPNLPLNSGTTHIYLYYTHPQAQVQDPASCPELVDISDPGSQLWGVRFDIIRPWRAMDQMSSRR